MHKRYNGLVMQASQQLFETLVMIGCTIIRKTKIEHGAPKTIFVGKDIIEMGEKKARVHGRVVANQWIDKEKEKEISVCVFLLLFLINWHFLNRLHDKNFSFHYYGLAFGMIALTGTDYNLNAQTYDSLNCGPFWGNFITIHE